MYPISGIWTLLIDNGQNLLPYTVDFQPNNVAVCPSLGTIGRYQVTDDKILMAFGDETGFIFDTKVMFYGQIVGNELQGICGDASQTHLVARFAASQHGSPYIPPNAGIWTVPITHTSFGGQEEPGGVPLGLVFRGTISGDQFGVVDLSGPTGTKSGHYTTYKYDATAEQLVVFAFQRLCVYGGVVSDLGGPMRIEGQFMNVLSGGGSGTWRV